MKAAERTTQLQTLQSRFTKHAARLDVLLAMERSGGERDVIGRDDASGETIFSISVTVHAMQRCDDKPRMRLSPHR
jgi:ABC-type hemin transport system substrate-binding protein